MELTGTRQIAADRQTVWAALNDANVLKASIPGCQEMSGSPETGFEATVKQKVGPVSATFKGAVQLSNVVPGESYTITGEGKGGAAGFAKGGADVRLEDAEGGGTLLTYDVRANVGGKLAQLGSRVIDGFSKKMADQFFDNFRQAVETPATEGAPAPQPGRPATAPALAARAAEAALAPQPLAPAPQPLAPAGSPAAPAGAEPEAAGTAGAAAAAGEIAPEAVPAPQPGRLAGAAAAPAGAEPEAARPATAPAMPASGDGMVARLVAWVKGLFGGR